MRIRKVCETEIGDSKGWHYFYATQITIDVSATCPDHPEAVTRDFSVIEEDKPMQITLHEGLDKRLKIKGYSFIASVDPSSTTFDFTMPYDAAIQAGEFKATESKTGDSIQFIILPETPYEYGYVDEVFLNHGASYRWGETFGTSSLLPQGTPMRVIYKNTDVTEKIINFELSLRLPL